jgi:site-specific DNA recombinase
MEAQPVILTLSEYMAGIYARDSIDNRAGTEDGGRAIDRYLTNCLTYAETIGATVVDKYTDSDKSATKEGVVRDDFDRILTDLARGRINMVIAPDQDRFLRNDEDSARILRLAKRRQIYFASPSGGILDLSKDGFRLQFRIKQAVSIAETERKGGRHLLENAQRAREGKRQGGGRQYGFNVPPRIRLPKGVSAEQLPEDDPRRLMAFAQVTINEVQANVIRDVARRLLVGESLTSIANDLNNRKLFTVNGKKWTIGSLRYTMLRASISGRREYKPLSNYEMRDDGSMRRPIIGEITCETSDYPAIITADDHDKIRAMLTDPARVTTKATPRRLLSGIARCQCGNPMTSRPRRRRNDNEKVPNYVCAKMAGRYGCQGVQIHAGHLDEHVQAIIVGALQDEEFRTRLHVADDTTDVAARLRAAEDELNALAAFKATTPSMSIAEYAILRRPHVQMIDECRAQLAQSDRGRALTMVDGPAEQMPAVWSRLSTPHRRLVIEALVDHIAVVKRSSVPSLPGNVFNPARFRVVFRDEI